MASIYQRGKIWWISYQTPNGPEQYSLKTRNKKLAELEKKRVEYEQALGAGAPVSHRFADYAGAYLAWRAGEFPDSQERIEQLFAKHLTPFFDSYELDQVDAPLARRYMTERRAAGAKPATITKELRSLKALCARAVEDGLLARHPLTKVRPPRDVDDSPPIAYTPEQLEALYAASPFHADRWRFLANTGLRRSDALNLLIENCRGDRALIISKPGARTKSAKTRVVPLNAEAQRARDALVAAATDEYLFPRITKPSFSRAFSRCAARAKLPGSIHSLRHTFVTRLLLTGADVKSAQMLAGHSTPVLTMRYAHPTPAHLHEAVKRLSDV